MVKSRTAAPAPSAGMSSGSSSARAGSGGLGGNGNMMGMDPDFMREMMDNPIMQSMLDNPALLQSLLTSNPATRELLAANPELRAALNDPETLRSMTAAARNPDLMAEMTRGQDRALANIESLPGGFNALRRMYETLGAPLEDSLRDGLTGRSGSSGSGSSGSAAPAPAPAGPVTDAMPNPWAPARSSAAAGPTGVGAGANPFAALMGGMGGGGGFGGFGTPAPSPAFPFFPGFPAAAPAPAPATGAAAPPSRSRRQPTPLRLAAHRASGRWNHHNCILTSLYSLLLLLVLHCSSLWHSSTYLYLRACTRPRTGTCTCSSACHEPVRCNDGYGRHGRYGRHAWHGQPQRRWWCA